jgi:hypothetical protein
MFHNKVLAVELSLPAFDPNRVDKGLSAEMADQKSANREMLAVRKRLLPKKQTADIHAHDVDTREWVESNTSPYAAGLRIIDTRNLDHFMGVEEGVKGMRQRIEEREDLVRQWGDAYESAVEEAKTLLQDAFNAADYPPRAKAVARFKFVLELHPISDGAHLFMTLAKETAEEIQRATEIRLKRAEQESRLDLIQKLATPLCKLASRVQFQGEAREGVAKIWEEMRGLVERIPRMNVGDDPRIEELRVLLKEDILGKFTADEVVEDTDARDKAKDAVRAILEKMKGYAAE